IARGCLISATPWTSAVTFPHGRNGLNARQMAVLSRFREPALCRHVHRELLRIALPDLTPIISATACHQRNYVERYSRFIGRAPVGRKNHRMLATRFEVGPPHQATRSPPGGDGTSYTFCHSHTNRGRSGPVSAS